MPMMMKKMGGSKSKGGKKGLRNSPYTKAVAKKSARR